MNFTEEQGADFLLRPWRAEDAAAILSHANDPGVAANLRDVFPSPYTLADGEWFVRDCMEKEGRGRLCRCIVIGGKAAGSIGLFLGNDVYRKSAELGYWLGRSFWGRGIMTAAVRALCEEGFRTWDIFRIYAEPFASNAGSRRVLEKAGFTLEGTLRSSVFKNGMLLDSCIYGRLRKEASS